MNEVPLTISELHNGLKSGVYTCVKLVDLYLARIKEKDPELNSFITVSENYAYSRAKDLDRVIKDNPNAFAEFPLLGVVIAVKDLFSTKGIRTTAASKLLENYIPQYSSTVVERIESAGAIVIGKTNCDAWAHGASGENSDYGVTKNPWNTDYVPGGSSSGSAVSVSAGFSLASLGTDTGGSIRQPASFCGVVGFKPTYGAVSRYGVIAMASSLDSMGHFTHTVEDSEAIFNVTRGEDGKDSTVKQTSYEAKSDNFVLGVPKEYFIDGLDKEVEMSVRSAINVYKNLGVTIKEISLPHTKYAISVYYIIQPAEVSSNLSRYDGVRFGDYRDSFGDEAKRRIMLGTYVLSAGYYDAYYLKAMKVRSKIISDFEHVFDPTESGVDAIIAPVSPTPAFQIGEKASDPVKMYLADVFTVSANLAGIPALSVPCGLTDFGLPLSFQLMGKRFSEKTLFELGKMYQNKTEWKKLLLK